MKIGPSIYAIRFAAFVAAILVSASLGDCQTVTVSIPALHTSGNERITGFEIHIQSGMIVRMPKVPKGWGISVDNDPSWNTAIKGSIDVGAAAVDPDFFRDFLVVEVEKDGIMNLPFALKGEVFVTEDFEHERRIKLAMKDFATKEAGEMKCGKQVGGQ